MTEERLFAVPCVRRSDIVSPAYILGTKQQFKTNHFKVLMFFHFDVVLFKIFLAARIWRLQKVDILSIVHVNTYLALKQSSYASSEYLSSLLKLVFSKFSWNWEFCVAGLSCVSLNNCVLVGGKVVLYLSWVLGNPFFSLFFFGYNSVVIIFFGLVCRYPGVQKEAFAESCPVCRKNCNCKACLRMEMPIKVSFLYTCIF